MAKRTRGSARPAHRRPGARPTSGRPQPARQQPAPSAAAEQENVGETAAVATPFVAAESTASAPPVRPGGHPRPRAKPGSVLAARSESEYAYVAQDLKRIAILSGLLFGLLFLLWLLVVVMRVVPLPFY